MRILLVFGNTYVTYAMHSHGCLECNGPGINANSITKFTEYCASYEAKAFYSCMYRFQRQAVCDWNKTADCVTLSFNIGFVRIHKDSVSGAGSVVLDMLLKFGILKYTEEGTWELEPNAKSQWLYSFGDRKSNKNCSSFLNTCLSNRLLTFEESSMQAKIFLDSFHNIMFLLGDWHTCMNMLQSIYKVFWVDLLFPMKTFLGWKQISSNVCGCYFQRKTNTINS